MMQRDKQLHFLLSAVIAGVVTTGLMSYGVFVIWAIMIGYSISITIGIIKELRDSLGYGSEDIKDIYADMLGSISGSILCAVLYSIL